MEEELREQPTMEPANALNKAEEERAVSEVGSQNETSLGKFKSVEALLDAYNNLQSAFTKKCQQLSDLEKDKIEDNVQENEMLDEQALNQFLNQNGEAKIFVDEIKNNFNQTKSPYQQAWADIVLSHLKDSDDKGNDPIVNQYILSDKNVQNKIIEEYLKELQEKKPPVLFASQVGERVSKVEIDTPKTLEEAKILTSKMFS